MTKIGTLERPLDSEQPMKVARAIIANEFETAGGTPGLWHAKGNFWVWQGGRWRRKDREEMVRACWRWMEDMHVMTGEAGSKTERLGPNRQTAEQAAWAMEALREMPLADMPAWIGTGEVTDPGTSVAFEDVVVDVKTGKAVTRDERWLDHVVMPCSYREAMAGRCERWLEAVGQWGNGDAEWGRLLQRWMGYCIMSGREYRKWMLMQGVTAGGKGTINHVLKAMLGDGMMIVDLDTLTNDYGLGGAEYARLISVNEVSRQIESGRNKGSRVVKSLVGQDPISINVKFQPIQKGVVCRAAVMMSSNQVPELENLGAGMSNKMLVLPITVGFDERGAEAGLKERLVAQELAGIMGWALRGAEELVAAGQQQRWPRPSAAEGVETQYRVLNSPMDAFLETCFVRDPNGWVLARMVRGEWKRFCKENRVKDRVPDNQLLMQVETAGSWNVQRRRKKVEGQMRMTLCGLSLRRERETDL